MESGHTLERICTMAFPESVEKYPLRSFTKGDTFSLSKEEEQEGDAAMMKKTTDSLMWALSHTEAGRNLRKKIGNPTAITTPSGFPDYASCICMMDGNPDKAMLERLGYSNRPKDAAHSKYNMTPDRIRGLFQAMTNEESECFLKNKGIAKQLHNQFLEWNKRPFESKEDKCWKFNEIHYLYCLNYIIQNNLRISSIFYGVNFYIEGLTDRDETTPAAK